jgi:hypothetical protein
MDDSVKTVVVKPIRKRKAQDATPEEEKKKTSSPELPQPHIKKVIKEGIKRVKTLNLPPVQPDPKLPNPPVPRRSEDIDAQIPREPIVEVVKPKKQKVNYKEEIESHVSQVLPSYADRIMKQVQEHVLESSVGHRTYLENQVKELIGSESSRLLGSVNDVIKDSLSGFEKRINEYVDDKVSKIPDMLPKHNVLPMSHVGVDPQSISANSFEWPQRKSFF